MKEGFWGNYETGIWFLIDEHEMWLRRPENAALLGIPSSLRQKIPEFRVQQDRDALLRFMFCHAPVMRIRAHGETVCFEFAADDVRKPLALIEKWCRVYAGPYMGISAFDFNSGKRLFCLWKDWDRHIPSWIDSRH